MEISTAGGAASHRGDARALRSRTVGALTFWKISDCERQASDLADVLPPEGSPDFVKIVLQLSGEVRVEKRGRTVVLRPGTLGFYGLSRTVDSLYVEEGSEQLVGIVPRQELAAHNPDLMGIMQRQFSPDSPTCALAFDFLTGLYEGADAFGPARVEMSNVAIHLLQVAVGEQHARMYGRSYREKARARITSYVDLRIRDPELSVEGIATAMRCSSRYLQKVFGGSETLGRYIWRTRLERCRSALEDPANAGVSVTEIAFSLGFSNASHFSRAFKERFGLTPRDCRDGARH
jgi:AraC-like DNA-binding protein